MRPETIDQRSVRSDERGVYARDEGPQKPMSPARRAALDALEREFQALVQAIPPR